MRPEVVQRSVASTGVLSTSKFHFGVGSEAHLFNLLRNSLYSDKPLALLREYWTNGRDAHVEAFLRDLPVDVALPTDIEPTLVIRDYGFGMSEDGIRNTFAAYGASTKRDSNESIGFMGIGSKSAHSYADVFTVTSFHAGMRTVYTCVIDESNIGDVNKVWVEPCGEETGIEIRIPVLLEDIPSFVRAATYLFTYATPTPNINIPLTPKVLDKKANGFLVRGANVATLGKWVAVMGSVPYNLDFSRMLDELREAGMEEMVAHTEGGLYFDIGEVSVAASREELEYTTRTKQAVAAGLKLLLRELMGDLDTLMTSHATPWEKRLAVQEFHTSTGIAVSALHAAWAANTVELYSLEPVKNGDGNPLLDAKGNPVTKAPKSFRLHGHRVTYDQYNKREIVSPKLDETNSVWVSPGARILIRDTNIPLHSYKLSSKDRVAVTRNRASATDVLSEVQRLLEEANLTGIPVVPLSTLDTTNTSARSGRGRPSNAKHTERRFVLRSDANGKGISSANWDVIDHTPGKEDVFVILSHFEVSGQPNFYSDIKVDRATTQYLGGVFPPIYGVKTTTRYPVNPTAVLGTQYYDWVAANLREILSQSEDIQRVVQGYNWSKLYSKDVYPYHRWDIGVMVGGWVEHLGDTHPIPTFLKKVAEQSRLYSQSKPPSEPIMRRICMANPCPNEAVAARRVLLDRYPMLDPMVTARDFGVVTETPKLMHHWVRYIEFIDRTVP